MSNYEGSRALISSHKCQAQSSSAMSTHEHGATVPNALMTTHRQAFSLLLVVSTALMSTHGTMATYLWVFIRVPEYSWVLIKLSWVVWSVPECSWVPLSAPVCSSGWFNNKQKMLTIPMPSLQYFENISVQISPNNKKNGYFWNLHKKGCWKMSKIKFLDP